MPSESIVVPHEDGAATSEQLACYANAHLSTANNPYLVSVIWWDAQSNFFVDFFETDKPKTQEMSERESHLGNVCRIRQKEQNSFKPRSVRPSVWPEIGVSTDVHGGALAASMLAMAVIGKRDSAPGPKRAWELWMARTLHREHITVADPPLPDLPPEEPTAGDSSTFCLSALLSASRRLLFVQGAACLP